MTATRDTGRVVRSCLRTSWLIAGVWCALTPSLAQTLGQGGDDSVPLWRVIVALGVCLALAVVVPFALKYRYGVSLQSFFTLQADKRRLRVIESLRIGNQANLCIVECDGEQLLMTIAPQGVQILKTLEPRRGGAEAG